MLLRIVRSAIVTSSPPKYGDFSKMPLSRIIISSIFSRCTAESLVRPCQMTGFFGSSRTTLSIKMPNFNQSTYDCVIVPGWDDVSGIEVQILIDDSTLFRVTRVQRVPWFRVRQIASNRSALGELVVAINQNWHLM